MEITWYGHSCFRLTERGLATVVTDPFDHNVIGYNPLKLRGDIVTVSHDAPGHNFAKAVKGVQRLISGPGEYEIGGVFITAVRPHKHGKRGEDNRNTLFVFDYHGVTIAHLGDLRNVPNQKEIEALGTINIALVPVGAGGGLNAAKAAEMVSLLEPGIVIPMHYQTPDCKLKLASVSKFLKEMGIGKVDPEPSLKIKAAAIPTEIRIVLLSYQH